MDVLDLGGAVRDHAEHAAVAQRAGFLELVDGGERRVGAVVLPVLDLAARDVVAVLRHADERPAADVKDVELLAPFTGDIHLRNDTGIGLYPKQSNTQRQKFITKFTSL